MNYQTNILDEYTSKPVIQKIYDVLSNQSDLQFIKQFNNNQKYELVQNIIDVIKNNINKNKNKIINKTYSIKQYAIDIINIIKPYLLNKYINNNQKKFNNNVYENFNNQPIKNNSFNNNGINIMDRPITNNKINNREQNIDYNDNNTTENKLKNLMSSRESLFGNVNRPSTPDFSLDGSLFLPPLVSSKSSLHILFIQLNDKSSGLITSIIFLASNGFSSPFSFLP